MFSLGIKTPEEQVAFNYVKAAKNTFYQNNDIENTKKAFEQALKIAPSFSYVMTEYSKFEFNIGHIPQALQLAKKATEIHEVDYHAWFNYGMMLKKDHQIDLSITALKKAKAINPNHLPIFNELGRAYTFKGDYESADVEFTNALRGEKYPNYRHRIFTLQFSADNYKRWAQSFIMRMDYEGAIGKLKKAYTIIQEAIEASGRTDRKLWELYWRICIDLGKIISKAKGFDAGKVYLEECIIPVYCGDVRIPTNHQIIAEACRSLVTLGMKQQDTNIYPLEKWINICMDNCPIDSEIFRVISKVKERLKNENDRKSGLIRWYNSKKKFGLIEIANDTYTFLLSGFRNNIPATKLENLDNEQISCVLIDHPSKPGQLIATDITFT